MIFGDHQNPNLRNEEISVVANRGREQIRPGQLWRALRLVVERVSGNRTVVVTRSGAPVCRGQTGVHENGWWPNPETIARNLEHFGIPMRAYLAAVRACSETLSAEELDAERRQVHAILTREVDGVRWPVGGRPADEGQEETAEDIAYFAERARRDSDAGERDRRHEQLAREADDRALIAGVLAQQFDQDRQFGL